MPDLSPSETLRAAAARIRECSPFALIAGKRVPVEPIAAWLDFELDRFADGYQTAGLTAALAFAHSILEPS